MKKIISITILAGFIIFSYTSTSAVKKLVRSPVLTSERTVRLLKRVHRLTQEGEGKTKGEAALPLLKRLTKKTKKIPHEYAQVLKAYGILYLERNNYQEAIKYFEQCLALETISVNETFRMMYMLAQLYMSVNNYQKTVTILNELFNYVEKPKLEAQVLLASAYARLKQFKKALKPITIAINSTNKDNNKNKIPENWYQLLLAIRIELKQYGQAVTVLEKMVKLYPQKANYWKQLAGIYIFQEQPVKALAILELAYRMGHLTKEYDIITLANLYLQLGIPVQSAQLLDKTLRAKKIKDNEKNLELLASSWDLAHQSDLAIETLEMAITKAQKSNLFVKLGHLYSQNERWKDAAQAFIKGLKIGKEENKEDNQREEIYLALGIAKHYAGQSKAALKYLKKASKSSKKSIKTQAVSWMSFIRETHET